MRMWHRMPMAAACVAVCGLGLVASAHAQICGDANGDGSVTVTDGVQVLRGAAELPSACTDRPNNCNIDGAGGITVTDGVNVLRKVAELAVTDNCPGGGATGDVTEVTDRLVPFLTLGLREVPRIAVPGLVAPAGGQEDCEDGGSRTTTQSGVTVRVDFANCQVSEPDLGRIELDGFVRVTIGFPTSTVVFELNVTDLDSSRLVDFDGEVQGTARAGGGFVIDGPMDVRDVENGPIILTLQFNDLEIDDDGTLISGSVQAEDFGNRFDLRTAELEVEDGNFTATLRVVRDDNSEQTFRLNLQTGELTPA